MITPEHAQTARYAKALSHPVRIAILGMLARQTCCYHGDMSEELPVAKSTLSQHLRELKAAGLIRGEIVPPMVRYCIDPPQWAAARQMFSHLFGQYDPQTADKSTLVMNPENDKKAMVKARYNQLALVVADPSARKSCSCTPAAPADRVFTLMSEDYTQVKGYEPAADLGVGCGLPTQYARIQRGDTVVDLGSGAGNDSFVAREEVGDTGSVIGVDFAPNMLAKARANAVRRGFVNVEFIEGDIEQMPLSDRMADIVVSNCVLNLLPRKDRIFKEIFRVLKPGGHFCVSDVVLNGVFPKAFTDNASLYAGCISSAIQREEYLGEIHNAGFSEVKVERTKTVVLPDDVLRRHLDPAVIREYQAGGVGIYSITVTGVRPL